MEHGPTCKCDYCREIQKLCPQLARSSWIWLIAEAVELTSEDRRRILLGVEEQLERDASGAQKEPALLISVLGGLVKVREELYLLDESKKMARKLRRVKDRLAEAERALAGGKRLLRAIGGERTRVNPKRKVA
jgi:hypothetical protein